MARHLVNPQLAGQVAGDKLAGFNDSRIHNFLRAERVLLHRAQQQTLQQVHPQLFGKAATGTLSLFDIGEQPIEFQ
ncbi:hypothetical protein D3C81_1949980 [compost metagenome]